MHTVDAEIIVGIPSIDEFALHQWIADIINECNFAINFMLSW